MEIFTFLWQFPADLERSAGCQQPIFFLNITEQIIFFTHTIEQTIFLRKNHTPPGIKWSAP